MGIYDNNIYIILLYNDTYIINDMYNTYISLYVHANAITFVNYMPHV